MLPKQGESHITGYLEEVLKKAGWRYEDLTHIACITGPGGFVSVRVGITVANVLSHFLDTPLAGVHLSELWEARVPEGFYWLHSTRRTQLFVRGFGEYAKKYPESTLIEIEEAAELKGMYVGELIEEHRKALPGCTPVSPSSIKALEEVLPSFLSKLSYKQEQLLPWYGREA
jgi:tRNA A37 threonylcarbamoyladenosine modification protein TsaB